MTEDASSAPGGAGRNWIVDHRAMYLQSGGAKGHVMELPAPGRHWFTTHCMLKYTGRKSGRTYITPLIYGSIGGEVVIVASNGGADRHPEWYLNIRGAKEVEFQISTEAFRASWREPMGAERAKVWNFVVEIFPSYTEYQAATDRQIPLVIMKPFERIAAFKATDVSGQGVR